MSRKDYKAWDIAPCLVPPCPSLGHPGSHSLRQADRLSSAIPCMSHIHRLEPSDHGTRTEVLWLAKDGAAFPPPKNSVPNDLGSLDQQRRVLRRGNKSPEPQTPADWPRCSERARGK